MRYFAILLTLTLVGIGCKSPTVQPTRADQVREFQLEQAQLDGPMIPVTTTRTKGAPSWIDNADRDGHLTAVGIAQKSQLGNTAFQREMAVNCGIAALGKKLSTRTEQLYLEVQQNSAAAKSELKKPSREELNQVSNVIRNLTATRVRGARVPFFWTDQADGTLYCLVQLDDNSSFEILREATIQQPALHEAVAKLDTELAKK